jgi:hypothetical protein
MGMLDAIAASLGSAAQKVVVQSSGAAAVTAQAGAAKPILQLNRFPVTLDLAIYRNAASGRNPGGDQRSLFAFRELVDPVPAFARTYSASAESTERVYEMLLEGASVEGESPFASGVLSDAKKRFEDERLAYLDGSRGSWRPVYAVPDDWPAAGPERFQQLDIDLNSLASSDGAFAVIGGDDTLELKLGGGDAGVVRQVQGTQLRSLRMEYLMVGLRRGWLNPTLFGTGDWFLSGQDAGFCSSGNLSRNDGVLPLIPTGLLLGRKIELSADWSSADTSLLQGAKSEGKPVFLGPFRLSGPGDAGDMLQVIGWTCDLVPFSPRITKERAGSILVDNSGGFVARFAVEWSEGADRRSLRSGNFPVLASKEIGIPVNASKIDVKIEIMTFPPPFETWKTVKVLSFDKPAVKRYELSGTTFNPGLRETTSPQ